LYPSVEVGLKVENRAAVPFVFRLIFPATSSFWEGDVVPMPTLPPENVAA